MSIKIRFACEWCNGWTEHMHMPKFQCNFTRSKTTANAKLLRIAITFIFNGSLFSCANSKNRKTDGFQRMEEKIKCTACSAAYKWQELIFILCYKQGVQFWMDVSSFALLIALAHIIGNHLVGIVLSSIYTCQLPIPPTYLTWNMFFLWMVRCQIHEWSQQLWYLYFSCFCSRILFAVTYLELRTDNNVTCDHQFIPNIKKDFS